MRKFGRHRDMVVSQRVYYDSPKKIINSKQNTPTVNSMSEYI